MLPVVILAGGLATRLRPITKTIPKALVEVAGKPFIKHQLTYLKNQGISEVVMCVGYLGEMISAEVGDGAEFGINVKYSYDGEKLMGTGGALRQALPFLRSAFFVLYGDSFLPINFTTVERKFEASGKPALMTVLKNCNQWDKSNVVYQNHQIVEYNKTQIREDMTHIDYGLGILRREVMERQPAGEPFDLAEVYHQLSINGQLAGHEIQERFYEIGSFEGLQETEMFLSGWHK
jgi:N-acetyl-alpha-D-muramate 1-phosphate uridylyltransferase